MLLTRWGADLLPMNWRWNPHENIILSNVHAVEVQNNSECAYGLQNSESYGQMLLPTMKPRKTSDL